MSAKKPLVSRQEWRIFALVSFVLSVIVGGITFLGNMNVPQESKNALPNQNPFRQEGEDTLRKDLLLSDYLLPAPGGTWLSRPWLYSRPTVQPWTAQEVMPYWTNVDQLPIVQLPKTNDRLIESMFKDVP